MEIKVIQSCEGEDDGQKRAKWFRFQLRVRWMRPLEVKSLSLSDYRTRWWRCKELCRRDYERYMSRAPVQRSQESPLGRLVQSLSRNMLWSAQGGKLCFSPLNHICGFVRGRGRLFLRGSLCRYGPEVLSGYLGLQNFYINKNKNWITLKRKRKKLNKHNMFPLNNLIVSITLYIICTLKVVFPS